jgi:hypothetical protein
MTEIHPSSLARFIRSVAVLALAAPEQLAYLAAVGIPEGVDELAMEFDDGQLLSGQFQEFGWITPAFRQRIAPLNALLDRMSGGQHADLWTAEALLGAPEWVHVRSLARDLLASV